MEWFLDPLQFTFMSRALIAAILVGIVCPVLGVYVVLRGMAFLGDALAHTILPGIVAAFLLGWPLAVGALLVGVFTAVGIGLLTEKADLKEDTAIGVIFVGMFALGIAMLSASGNYAIDLAHFLFGNLLGVSVSDLWLIGGLATAVLLTVFLFYKEFLLISFDPILAQTLRLPVSFFRYLLLILIAVTIVISLQVVGLALALAMFITPAATASLLSNRLAPMMAIATGLGLFSSITGLYLSYYFNIASGAAIVLVATSLFVLAFLCAPGRGLIWRRVMVS